MNKPIIDNSITGIRSKQDVGFNWTGSADFGRLVPFHVQELIGTDKVVTCKPRIEMQMLPLVSPTFGKMDIYIHYFFVPTRLCWKNFYDFYSQTGANKNAEPPYWFASDFYSVYNSELDENYRRALYKHFTSMGLPPFFVNSSYAPDSGAGEDPKISLLPFRAYNQIWWDFYRDPEVLQDQNKISYIIDSDGHQNASGVTASEWYLPHVRSLKDNWISDLFVSGGLSQTNMETGLFGRGYNDVIGVYGSEVAAQKLRQIEAVTRMAERLSLSGKRQIDQLYSQYGIKPEWTKLNMCQYVGGAKSTVLISDITSSADTIGAGDLEGGAPLGMKAGAGYCALSNLSIKYTAQEPGYLIGILSVMPHVHYVQGLGKQWIRNSREDWFTKQLEHVGQVAVPKREVRVSGETDVSRAEDAQTFAFTQPYYEYKRGVDILAGDFMKYHSDARDERDIKYMQSMDMFIDYPQNRRYNLPNLSVNPLDFNKVFYYLGGETFTDTDDHFHICCDVDCVINRPMDGYAVPTIETTNDPHKATSALAGDVVL